MGKKKSNVRVKKLIVTEKEDENKYYKECSVLLRTTTTLRGELTVSFYTQYVHNIWSIGYPLTNLAIVHTFSCLINALAVHQKFKFFISYSSYSLNLLDLF